MIKQQFSQIFAHIYYFTLNLYVVYLRNTFSHTHTPLMKVGISEFITILTASSLTLALLVLFIFIVHKTIIDSKIHNESN